MKPAYFSEEGLEKSKPGFSALVPCADAQARWSCPCLIILVAAGAFVVAGFQAPPSITFSKPGDFAGAAVPIEFSN
jgi:hypothetical protein